MTMKPRVSLTRSVKAAVVKNSVHEVFASRLRRAGKFAKTIVIASPWISSEGSGANTLKTITSVVQRHNVATYVFTRAPQNQAHRRALDTLAKCPSVEIVFNESLHAKIYACLAPYPYGFALLGSANMTDASSQLYEVGLIVLSTGGGEETVRELASYGLDFLRTRPESIVFKRISLGR